MEELNLKIKYSPNGDSSYVESLIVSRLYDTMRVDLGSEGVITRDYSVAKINNFTTPSHAPKEIKHAVSVLLINEEGLVCHVSRKDDHSDWALIGGKVDPEDTSPEVAAIRETMEETGITISNLMEVYCAFDGGYMGHTYIADYSGEINFDSEKEPHLVEWKTYDHAMNGSFGNWNRHVWKSLKKMGIKLKVS